MSTTTSPQRVKVIYHADLRDAHPDEDYWLVACGRHYPLVPHTSESRASAKIAAPELASTPDECLTHRTVDEVDLPADSTVRVHIRHSLRHSPGAKGDAGFGHVAIHVPPLATQAVAHAAGIVSHKKIDWPSTAIAFVFHHPELICKDPEISDAIHAYMKSQDIASMFGDLGDVMRKLGLPSETSGWARLVPYTPPKNSTMGQDGNTTYYTLQPTDTVIAAAAAVTRAMMLVTKNDMSLAGKKWTLQSGTAVEQVEHDKQALRLLSRIDAEKGDDWSAALGNTGEIHGLQSSISVLDSGARRVQLTMSNTYMRFLGAYVRFYDADGNPVQAPNWKIDNPGALYNAVCDALDAQYPDLRYLGFLTSVNSYLGVPITSDPGTLQVSFTFPENAVSASIYGSGLGTGSNLWPKTPLVGGVMTGVMNFGVPALMMGFGAAALSYKPLYEFLHDPAVVGVFISLGLSYFGPIFAVGAANHQMDWSALSMLGTILFDPALSALLEWIIKTVAVDVLIDMIPFVGWVAYAADVLADVAQMAQTVVEVVQSPWNIENTLSTAITTAVNVYPDPRKQGFPLPPTGSTASLQVKMIYHDQTRPTLIASVAVPAESPPIPLTASFPSNTLGGQVKFEADYYIDTWLAGKATTGLIANDEADIASVDLHLVQYPTPLSDQSVYLHTSLLTYQNDAYVWQRTGSAPTATVSVTDTRSTGNAISIWSGLTHSERHAMVGSAWKAAGMGITSYTNHQGGQLFAMQSGVIPGARQEASEFPSSGLEQQTLLVYDPYPPKFLMDNGNWKTGADGNPLPDPSAPALGNYYVDPRKAAGDPYADGGFHLRKVVLSPPTAFDLDGDQPSYGRFQFQPDSIALHPTGAVVAVCTQYAKIQIGQLVLGGAADKDVPMARVYAGQAQVPGRPGLLFHPVAVTCAYDGTVFVLEDTKSGDDNGVVLARIQAFDLYGNPVNRFFDNGNKPTSCLNLSSSGENTYLDLCAVGDLHMTYLYVLYYSGEGSQASDYHMTIYQYGKTAPASNPLVTTDGLAAARLSVDMWHGLYSLNYAMVTDGNGQPAGPRDADTGPGGRTVPSISQWLPPPPTHQWAS